LFLAKKRQLDDTTNDKIIKPVENAEKFILVIVLADACLAAVHVDFLNRFARSVNPTFCSSSNFVIQHLKGR
jgi:hypothetical protein